MKHIKIFEEFVNESNPKVTAMRKKLNDELEKVRAELGELFDRKDEIEAAADSGDMDYEEAELQMSDLDGFQLDLEAKRDAINKKLEALKGK